MPDVLGHVVPSYGKIAQSDSEVRLCSRGHCGTARGPQPFVGRQNVMTVKMQDVNMCNNYVPLTQLVRVPSS